MFIRSQGRRSNPDAGIACSRHLTTLQHLAAFFGLLIAWQQQCANDLVWKGVVQAKCEQARVTQGKIRCISAGEGVHS